MQFALPRVSAARPTAAAPAQTPGTEHISAARCVVVTQASRQPVDGARRRHSRAAAGVREDDEPPVPSSRRVAKAQQPKPTDAKETRSRLSLPKDNREEPGDSSEEGVGGLDELLSDADVVRQLRSSLLASLSAQHQEATREEEQQLQAPSTVRQQPDHQQREAAGSTKGGKRAGRGSKATASDDHKAKLADSSATSTSNAAADAGAAAATAAGGGDAPMVVLKKDKARLFVYGNPMVYGGAVDCVIGRPPPGIGDAVMVADASRRLLGWGVFNPHSMFRVRLLQLQPELESDPQAAAARLDVPALLRLRVRQATALRRALGLPSQDTNVYRLINSEGDRLSGLVADVLGDTVVVQAVAGWVQRYRSDVEAALRAETGLTRVVWRPLWKILAEEGLQPPLEVQGEGTQEEREGTQGEGTQEEGGRSAAAVGHQTDAAVGPEAEAKGSEDEERVEVREAGLRLVACPQGQKTGFYADQRESRAFLAGLVRVQAAQQQQLEQRLETQQPQQGAAAPREELVADGGGGEGGQGGRSSSSSSGVGGGGPTVLDLCCYSGGFALAAAAAGASRVVGVDSSEAAIFLAVDNARLNGLEPVASFVRADVSDFMKAAVAEGQQYDIAVLDPPKLAPDRNSLARARIKYLRLNTLAMKLVRPGGLLMTCSCSGAMTQSGEFTEMLVEAARQVGRQPTVLREAGAAPDHPLHPAYPEGEYLTNVTLRLL